MTKPKIDWAREGGGFSRPDPWDYPKEPIARQEIQQLWDYVEALRKRIPDHGLFHEILLRGAMPFLCEARARLWARDRFNRSVRTNCLARLIGKRCKELTSYAEECPYCQGGERWIDHGALYLGDKDEKVFTSQPYGLSFEGLCNLVDFCREHSLEATIDAHWSYHFPGSTVLIWVQKPTKETPVRSLVELKKKLKI